MPRGKRVGEPLQKLVIYLTESQHEALKRLAGTRGMSVLARDLLQAWIDARQDRPQEAPGAAQERAQEGRW